MVIENPVLVIILEDHVVNSRRTCTACRREVIGLRRVKIDINSVLELKSMISIEFYSIMTTKTKTWKEKEKMRWKKTGWVVCIPKLCN